MIPQLYDKFQEWADQGTIWVISDTHFGDEELRQGIPGRPSDDELVKLINSKVGRKDTLIHLGDVGDVSYVQQLRAGRKVLIMGNHDAGASNYKRSSYDSGFIHDNHLFDEVYEGPVIIGPKLILSHEPIMNLPIMFNIHGHVHCQAHNIPKHLNACLDINDYQPIHFNSLMKSGIFKDIDDIHRVTIDTATKRVKHRVELYKKNQVNKNHQIFEDDDFIIDDDMVYTIPGYDTKPIKVVLEGPIITKTYADRTMQEIADEIYEAMKKYKL